MIDTKGALDELRIRKRDIVYLNKNPEAHQFAAALVRNLEFLCMKVIKELERRDDLILRRAWMEDSTELRAIGRFADRVAADTAEESAKEAARSRGDKNP